MARKIRESREEKEERFCQIELEKLNRSILHKTLSSHKKYDHLWPSFAKQHRDPQVLIPEYVPVKKSTKYQTTTPTPMQPNDAATDAGLAKI